MERDDELVVGLPRRLVLPNGGWHGIRTGDIAHVFDLLDSASEARPRSEAEVDEDWKQIIPYLLLRDGERIFLMKRTKAGGDARLHERWSIGVGGHLGPEDDGLLGGLRREFHEELVADWDPEPRILGLLNDDTTPVGRVHVGVCYVADAHGRSVAIREIAKLSGAFVAPAEIRAGYEHLETWSQLLLDAAERAERA